MLRSRSRVTTDEAGWTWLMPERGSLTLRHALVSFVLSVLFVLGAAALTLPPPLVAVPLATVVTCAGVALARTTWRDTHSRVGVSALGVLVQQGTRQEQLAWPAVRGIAGDRSGRRVHIVVATTDQTVRTATTYGLPAAERFLTTCEELAAHRRLQPLPAPGGLGFVAGA